jgi:hypothetical protein
MREAGAAPRSLPSPPMRSVTRAFLALFAALALAAGLAACGGGGSGSTSSAPSSSAQETPSRARSPRPSPKPPSAKAKLKPSPKTATAKPAPMRKSAPPPALVRKAGHAAPFLVPTGDNSVPTYGSESSASQRGQAEAALRAYLAARARGEWSAACAHMGSAVRGQVELLAKAATGKARGCAEADAMLSARVPAAARANVLSGPLAALRVKGDKAFALFYGPHAQQYMMPMAREGGTWKVNQLDPIPWPIGAPAHAP